MNTYIIIQKEKGVLYGMTKGNPNGRPPSAAPRETHIHVKLSETEANKLDEAARLLDTTKTKVIVRGIEKVYDEAAAEAWKRQKESPPE